MLPKQVALFLTDNASWLISGPMLFSVTVACLGYMAGSGRPVGLATRSCVSMKKTVEEAEPAERPEINIAMNSIVEFQVTPDDTMQNNRAALTKPNSINAQM